MTRLLLTVSLALVLRTGLAQVSTTPDPGSALNCTGLYSGISTRGELYRELLDRVLAPLDSDDTVQIKSVFLGYLTQTPAFLDMIRCGQGGLSRVYPRQEDEDGDEDGDGGNNGGGIGGAAGAIGALTGTNANPLDNTNVLNGVRRILANVFTGNLIGVIQESVGLRSPEPVSTVFTDVLSTLFGSTATAGITGIIGNITTTPVPLNITTTLLPPGYEAYIQQHYLQQQYLQQQQQLLLQQQQQLAGASGGIGPLGGAVGGSSGAIGGSGGSVPVSSGILQQQQQQQQVRPVQQGGVVGNAQQLGGGGLSPSQQHQYLQQQYLQQNGNGRPAGGIRQQLVPQQQARPLQPQLIPQQTSPAKLAQPQKPVLPPQKQTPQEDYYEDTEDD